MISVKAPVTIPNTARISASTIASSESTAISSSIPISTASNISKRRSTAKIAVSHDKDALTTCKGTASEAALSTVSAPKAASDREFKEVVLHTLPAADFVSMKDTDSQSIKIDPNPVFFFEKFMAFKKWVEATLRRVTRKLEASRVNTRGQVEISVECISSSVSGNILPVTAGAAYTDSGLVSTEDSKV
jgi:hypothetical protein